MARTIKPQQTESQQRVISRGTLSLGRSYHGLAPVWAGTYPANVIAGEGVFEIGGGRQRGYGFIWELPSQHFAESRAKLRASEFASFQIAFPADELELICSGAAEPRHAQCQAPIFVDVDADHAANQGAFGGPQVQQGGAGLFTHLVLEVFKRGNP